MYVEYVEVEVEVRYEETRLDVREVDRDETKRESTTDWKLKPWLYAFSA
jgi:hypothetical protein